MDYDDSAWESGPGGIGYGYPHLATVLDDMHQGYSSVYLRAELASPEAGTYRRIFLNVAADDGFVAYLNGKEICRARVGDEAVLPHDAFAVTRINKNLSSVEVELSPGMFPATSSNVLAIQGLNFTLDSSDLALVVSLTGERVPDRDEHQRLVDRFRAVASGAGVQTRVAYLQGRLLQEEGRHADAVAHLTLAVANDDNAILPRAALTRSLRELRRTKEAAKIVGEILVATRPGRREWWNRWLALWFADPDRSLEEVASVLPFRRADTVPTSYTHLQTKYYVEDVEWLFERLQRREPIRVNCGGREYRDDTSKLWADDCFHRADRALRGGEKFTGDIEATRNDRLYQTGRLFDSGGASTDSLPGYTIPLPSGRYRLVLHFAETRLTEPGRRVFDVLAEDTPLLERFEVAPYATAVTRSFDIAVEDGLLELDFRPRREKPMISAIEIHRHDSSGE